MAAKPHVLVLGANFAGLTAARFIREKCGDAIDMTVIDRKPYLVFVPNIPMEVMSNHDPADTLYLETVPILHGDDVLFLEADVTEIDLDKSRVTYVPTERLGAAPERIDYDYLVICLGSRLAYDKIEGFGQYGHTLSDSFYGNRLREYLFEGGYKGGPIAIGSARFHPGTRGKPDWLPISKSACEGPPLEIALSLTTYLQDRKLGGPDKIILFTPAEVIAEDAGETIMKEFLGFLKQKGYGYMNNTKDITRIAEDGIEFASGDSLEAELKIVFPDWVPHSFIKELPIADESGFVVTDLKMRCHDRPNVFAAGDAAALTVPKLGAHGHQQAEIVAKQLGKEVGKVSEEEADTEFKPEIICIGSMGHHRAFYIHTDEWYGGDISVFKMGYVYLTLKIAFKDIYYRTGGKPPTWGIPLTEFVAEKVA